MKSSEIRAKFDEIVAFSEVEKFLETPVKRYSSGMRVRLAFSVAAHLDPELRHHFLFQIAQHRDIIDDAARAGLSIDAGTIS